MQGPGQTGLCPQGTLGPVGESTNDHEKINELQLCHTEKGPNSVRGWEVLPGQVPFELNPEEEVTATQVKRERRAFWAGEEHGKGTETARAEQV